MGNGTLSLRWTSVAADLAGKHVTFRVARDSFGVPVLYVREIRRIQSYTPLHGAPDCFKGSINSRGRIAPVVDLRRHLGLAPAAASGMDCVVVVEVPRPYADVTVMGLVVDALEGIINVGEGDLEEALSCQGGHGSSWFRTVTTAGGKSTLLLDLEQLGELGELHHEEAVPVS